MKDALGHGSNGRGGRVAKPIPNSPYHRKSDDELRYIQRDAAEAGRNAQEMGDDRGVNKYADQVNDASTVLGYRARGGLSDHPDAVAARALASGPKSAPVPYHDGQYRGMPNEEAYDREMSAKFMRGK
jgi:hypothetical protein